MTAQKRVSPSQFDRLMVDVPVRLPRLQEQCEMKRLAILCLDHFTCSNIPSASLTVDKYLEYLDEVEI